MRRATVMVGLIAAGTLSLGVKAFQSAAQQGPKVIDSPRCTAS